MKSWENLDADVVKLLTKHYTRGRSGRSIDKVVVHYNAGNLTVEGCYSVWQTREASAHYQVEDDGRIGQLVYDYDQKRHIGKVFGSSCLTVYGDRSSSLHSGAQSGLALIVSRNVTNLDL